MRGRLSAAQGSHLVDLLHEALAQLGLGDKRHLHESLDCLARDAAPCRSRAVGRRRVGRRAHVVAQRELQRIGGDEDVMEREQREARGLEEDLDPVLARGMHHLAPQIHKLRHGARPERCAQIKHVGEQDDRLHRVDPVRLAPIVEHEGLNDLHRVATLARRLKAKLSVQRHLLDVLERHVQAAVVPVVEG